MKRLDPLVAWLLVNTRSWPTYVALYYVICVWKNFCRCGRSWRNGERRCFFEERRITLPPFERYNCYWKVEYYYWKWKIPGSVKKWLLFLKGNDPYWGYTHFFAEPWSSGRKGKTLGVRVLWSAFVDEIEFEMHGNWLVVCNIFYVHPGSLGKWSNLTIFFKWVGSTTKQEKMVHCFEGRIDFHPESGIIGKNNCSD